LDRTTPSQSRTSPDDTGLRGRKKAKRRRELLRCAERLFARDGVDATTVAAIASEASVSPPTVFNYFGSKENILSSLIFEGAQIKRARHLESPRRTDCDFADVLGTLLCECTENTMKIAGKRVWRFAEAANIRRPNTEFGKLFVQSDTELLNMFTVFLGDYDMVLRSGDRPDARFLATLLFDRWTALYFAYIKDDAMPIKVHKDQIQAYAREMVELVFDEEFARTSPLKTKGATE
jgi:AcrR family transcriptional regulator